MWGRHSLEDLQQAVVVTSRHHDVDVVVPGDVAAVTHRAQQRPVGQVVGQRVGAADPVELDEHTELDGAELLEGQLGRVGCNH